MPQRPMKPCNVPACRNLTRSRYCESHQEKVEEDNRERQKYYDTHHRDKKAASFYTSKEWDIARKQALIRDNGLCVVCLMNKVIKMAEMVDHIIPVKIAWHLRTYLANLQSLCNACHAVKTAEDKLKYKHLLKE